MSISKKVKEIIINFLKDGKVHEAKEIKTYIMNHTDEIVSEGVIAGCLKTMTTNGTLEKVERGMYRLSEVELSQVNQTENENKREKALNETIYSKIVELTNSYKHEAFRIINEIDITEENKDIIFSAMNLRKKIDHFCEDIQECTF